MKVSVFRVLIPQTVFWGIFFLKCCHCLLTLLSFWTFLLGSMNFIVVCVQIESKGFNYFSPNNCAKHRKWIISLTMSVRQNCIQFRLIFSSCSVTVSAVNVSVGVVMCHEFSLRLVWVNWPSLYWLHDPTTQSAFLKIISRNFEPSLLSSSMLLELTFFLFFFFLLAYTLRDLRLLWVYQSAGFFHGYTRILNWYYAYKMKVTELGWIKIGCIGCNIADLHLVFGIKNLQSF